MQFRSLTQVAILVCATLWVASCGQKGPLYLPEEETRAVLYSQGEAAS